MLTLWSSSIQYFADIAACISTLLNTEPSIKLHPHSLAFSAARPVLTRSMAHHLFLPEGPKRGPIQDISFSSPFYFLSIDVDSGLYAREF